MLYDLPLDQLEIYKPPRQEPADFDSFWRRTINSTRAFPLAAQFEQVDVGLQTLDTYDVTFAGFEGQPIKAWFILPRYRGGRLPCVVEYIGYNSGRGLAVEWLFWASAGYAHFVMDTRGQGSGWRSPSDTPDIAPQGYGPHYPGFVTLGILDPETYYYRRVFMDALRAVEAAKSFPEVDADRIAVTGFSQGGGIAIAVGGLVADVSGVMPDSPFLCHYRRGTEIINAAIGYTEIAKYLQVHRDQVDRVFGTLAYFDGMNFATRSRARALFSVGLMDDLCPPSTVFAAYNHYSGPKDIKVYPYNYHEGGEGFQSIEKLKFMHSLCLDTKGIGQ